MSMYPWPSERRPTTCRRFLGSTRNNCGVRRLIPCMGHRIHRLRGRSRCPRRSRADDGDCERQRESVLTACGAEKPSNRRSMERSGGWLSCFVSRVRVGVWSGGRSERRSSADFYCRREAFDRTVLRRKYAHHRSRPPGPFQRLFKLEAVEVCLVKSEPQGDSLADLLA
jgi:hypothetical protein